MEASGVFHWLDIVVVVVYFTIVLFVGVWTIFRPQRDNVQGYFLAGRTMPWFAVGASLFSSNIGSEHFVGLAGAGAAGGIALVLYEWFPIFLILILGWLFLPVYVSAGVYTLPEYIGLRYGGSRIRIYLSCVALVLYIITKLAAAMFSGALFIQLALRWDMYLSLAVLLVVTGIYTVLGGLTAVMYTDTFQTVVMLVGSVVVMITSFVRIGGYMNLERLYFDAVPAVRNNDTTCGLPRDDAFHVFQDPVTGDQPWPGLVLQSSLGCLWYWCCDQVIVQRSLAAKNLSQAKGGSLLAGLLKIFPLFMLVFPGMISRILFPDEVACVDPDICQEVCDNPVGCSNIAYPKLVLELLPLGARGLLMAVMLSAIMSSLTSIFNSASTVFTMDIWRKIRPSAKQRELLIVGRIFVIVMCVVAILWVPMVKAFQSGRLFSYMVAVEGYVGSPLGVLFLLSIFWKRTTETGAFFGLILGHIAGIIRLIVELKYPAPPCGEIDERPYFLSKFHFSYFVQSQLLFTAIMITVISLTTKPRSESEACAIKDDDIRTRTYIISFKLDIMNLLGVTWWTKHRPVDADDNDMEDDPPSSTNGRSRTPGLTLQKQSPLLSEIQDDQPTSKIRHFFKVLCGLHLNDTAEEKLDLSHIRSFLTQSKTSGKLLNFGAVALMVAVAFITGFYR